MKRKNFVVNSKDRQKGRRIIQWATTGMNFAEGESLQQFKTKAKQMRGNPCEEARVGKALRGLEVITQSAAHAAVEGRSMEIFFQD